MQVNAFVFFEIHVTAQVYLDRPIASSSSGMRDALLDLWLLGRTDALVPPNPEL